MVDDPSAYVEVLRADPKLHMKAETALKARLKLWEEAKDLAEKAKGTTLSAPEPGPAPTLDDVLADQERQRLFRIIEDLVLWENTTNETVLQAARDEIWQSWRRACAENADHPRAKELFNRHKLPAFHDPFAGGGALPLEAQRLGLESYASDLNPVAVLINKAMIEIPPKFAGRPPVNPEAQRQLAQMDKRWLGAQGLAEDVRHYGQWMRNEAEKRIGHIYPKIEVTAEMVEARPDLKHYAGEMLTAVGWLWARTVKSPNPAFAQVDVPLASTFLLSTRAGKEAYVEPVIENSSYRFVVRVGKPKDAAGAKRGTKSGGSGSSFLCLMSGTPMPFEYLRPEAKAGRMGARLMAIVAEGDRGRVFLSPTPEVEAIALTAEAHGAPDTDLPAKALGFRVQEYGMTKWRDLFTLRQLAALTTFSDLAQEARELVQRDAIAAGLLNSGTPLRDGGRDAFAYAEAVSVYLAFCVDKMTDTNTLLCSWQVDPPRLRATFGRQALPMVWDYAEANIFGDAAGDFGRCVRSLTEVLDKGGLAGIGAAQQADAQSLEVSEPRVFSTDPPYYDNIGYADLSDFFYVWLRRSMRTVFPDLFATLAVPKAEELVATPFRHGNKDKAEAFFLTGMTQAMRRLAAQSHPAFPVTIYYAFKQSESQTDSGTASTGWETFLDAVLRAGFGVSGTWPMRSELATRNVGRDTNALASSIVLVCRPRAADAAIATRRAFVTALKAELPAALADLQRGNIAPVDLAQAAIGPGMAVYTHYATVLDAEGKPLTVREALALINQTLDEALAEQEGDFDADSRWALTWFEQSGFDEGEYGAANVLAQAKNTGMNGLVDAGIVASKSGRVRLLKPVELPADWDPSTDQRLTAWEIVHQLIRALESGGESAAALLVAKLGAKAEVARELCYRLYTLCERKKRAPEALSYNGLVLSWPEIMRMAQEQGKSQLEPAQAKLL
jgi:putative DNA methylase